MVSTNKQQTVYFTKVKFKEKDVYQHNSGNYVATCLENELIIYSKNESRLFFIKDHNEKLEAIGSILDLNKNLANNITKAIDKNIIKQDARFGFLGKESLRGTHYKDLADLTELN